MKKKETDLTKIDSSVLYRLIGRSILFLAMMTVVLFLFMPAETSSFFGQNTAFYNAFVFNNFNYTDIFLSGRND